MFLANLVCHCDRPNPFRSVLQLVMGVSPHPNRITAQTRDFAFPRTPIESKFFTCLDTTPGFCGRLIRRLGRQRGATKITLTLAITQISVDSTFFAIELSYYRFYVSWLHNTAEIERYLRSPRW